MPNVPKTTLVAAPVPTYTDQRRLELRIEAEFSEMQGLRLTLAQAARLFGLDRTTCFLTLQSLVWRGVLTNRQGSYQLRRFDG